MSKRRSGILMHVSSLPSGYGIGDLGPWAYKFVDFLERTGQSYWQILPLSPTDPVQGNSPYASVSTFAGNCLLISPELMVEQGFLGSEDLDPIPAFPEDSVDYPAVIEYKMRLLDRAYERFKASSERDEFQGFVEQNSHWLEDYALFAALKVRKGSEVWSDWEAPVRDRHAEALEEVRKELGDLIERQRFIQFLFFRQWFALKKYCNDRGVRVFGDIPIYVSYDSSDVWADPQIFKLDDSKKPRFVAGVPPDYFSATGQLWGNPVYDWKACKASGFSWWLRRMGHVLSLYDVVRIDHFRGLVAYWEVAADEKTAVNGQWVEAPVDDFLNTLRKQFPEMPIVAEDLGLITEDVREVMERYGLPGMKVLLFAFGEDNPAHPYLPHNYSPEYVVYTGTHDNNTVKGWFENETDQGQKDRLYRYLGRPVAVEKLHWEMIRLALASVAETAVIPMQDLLGLSQHARMNQPGQLLGFWQWRLKPDQLTSPVESQLAEMTYTYGR
jgi:4-alpha-glucanotransferase